MSTLCPACQSELDPASASCPVCMRPRSRAEVMRSFAEIKKEELRRRRVPLLVAAGVALIGLAIWGGPLVYRQAGPVIGRDAASIIQRVQEAMNRAESPDSYATSPSKPVAATATLVFTPVSRQPPAPRPQAPAAPAPAQPSPQTTPRWKVSGQVYDLLSLKPAAGAQLAFTAPDGTVTKAEADAGGNYAVSLTPLSDGGYALSVKRGRGRADFIEEGYTPFSQMSAAQRQDQVRDALSAKILHVPLTVDESGTLLYNVALLPKPRK